MAKSTRSVAGEEVQEEQEVLGQGLLRQSQNE